MLSEKFVFFEDLEQLACIPDRMDRFKKSKELVLKYGTVKELIINDVSKNQVNCIKHRVILLHGIRTNAPWYERAKGVFNSSNLIRTITPGYGRTNIFSVAIPYVDFPIRKEIEKAINENYAEDYVTSVVAHSFGTFLVTNILIRNPDIQLYRLIMCGSITSSKLFDKIKHKPHQTIHDVGEKDIFPVFARLLPRRFGSAGYSGLRHSNVDDRFHDRGHSFDDEEFMKAWWLPFLTSGEVKPSPDNRSNNNGIGWKIIHLMLEFLEEYGSFLGFVLIVSLIYYFFV